MIKFKIAEFTHKSNVEAVKINFYKMTHFNKPFDH